jgi:hypothetical protein
MIACGAGTFGTSAAFGGSMAETSFASMVGCGKPPQRFTLPSLLAWVQKQIAVDLARHFLLRSWAM